MSEIAGASNIAPLPEGLWLDSLRELRRNPVAICAAVVILVFASIALFPGIWTSVDPRTCDVNFSRQPPSHGHIFGTSELGCDYYAMTIYGARPSLVIASLSTAGMLLIGGILGLFAGYCGGWIDIIISRIADVVLALPFILGALVILVMLKSHSVWPLSGTFVLLSWPPLFRVMRASVLAAREQNYVTAGRAIGASTPRLIFRHVLPNSLAAPLVVATVSFGVFVSAEATLSYLGVGLRPPVISWGIMIFNAQDYFLERPHLLAFAGGALVLVVLSFILLGDALRDALDPKRR